MQVDRRTSKRLMPQGVSIMYSSFEYFSKLLLFHSLMFFKRREQEAVLSLHSRTRGSGMSKCSLELLSDIGVILEKAHQLDAFEFGRTTSAWAAKVAEWREAGFCLAPVDNVGSFLRRSSVVVDRSVFLLSNSSTDLEPSPRLLLGKKLLSVSGNPIGDAVQSKFCFGFSGRALPNARVFAA